MSELQLPFEPKTIAPAVRERIGPILLVMLEPIIQEKVKRAMPSGIEREEFLKLEVIGLRFTDFARRQAEQEAERIVNRVAELISDISYESSARDGLYGEAWKDGLICIREEADSKGVGDWPSDIPGHIS
jgi:hypothetical protein